MSSRVMGHKKIGTPVTAPSGILAVLGNGGTMAARQPGYQERKPQLDLAAKVAEGFKTRKHVLGEAGTGVGKSYAYTVPAALSRTQTLIAVPTIALQEQLIGKDLPRLAEPGILPHRFTYALLKGRGNYACRLKADRFLAQPELTEPVDGQIIRDVQSWYNETADGDLGKLSISLPMALRSEITTSAEECLGEACPSFDSCFAETAKSRAKNADIIVTNYAMVMLDLRLRKETGGIVSLFPDTIGQRVMDECHQLREKAQDALTKEVTLSRWTRIERRIRRIAEGLEDGHTAEDWMQTAEAIGDDFAELLLSYSDRLENLDETAIRLGDEIEGSHDLLVAMWRTYVRMIESRPAELTEDDVKIWDKTAENLAELVADILACVAPSNGLETVRQAVKEGEGEKTRIVLSVTPVDVAPFLRKYFWSDGIPTVCVSATVVEGGSLTNYRESVGLDECSEIMVGSPFNYVRDTLLYIPEDEGFDSSIARKDQSRGGLWDQYLDRLSDECTRLINASKGRAFLLFTSRVVMNGVYNRMLAQRGTLGATPYPMLRQGDFPMAETVARFKESPSVLFGLKSYWEGVDIAGDALSLVVILGMPFTPPSDPINAARCELMDRRHGRGARFDKIIIPEAIIALKQGFGRGKRTESDRAVMAILDGRLRHKNYGSRVLSSLPPSPLTGDFAAVRRFFQ